MKENMVLKQENDGFCISQALAIEWKMDWREDKTSQNAQSHVDANLFLNNVLLQFFFMIIYFYWIDSRDSLKDLQLSH